VLPLALAMLVARSIASIIPPSRRTVNTKPLPGSLVTITSPPIMRAAMPRSARCSPTRNTQCVLPTLSAITMPSANSRSSAVADEFNRHLEQLLGRLGLHDVLRQLNEWRSQGVDLSLMLTKPGAPNHAVRTRRLLMECYQIDAPKQAEGANCFWTPASLLKPPLASKIFFYKNAFRRKATPFLGQKPFLDRFLGEGA
jgi:hypothetical protein